MKMILRLKRKHFGDVKLGVRITKGLISRGKDSRPFVRLTVVSVSLLNSELPHLEARNLQDQKVIRID